MFVRKPSEFIVVLFLATGAAFVFNVYGLDENYRTEPLPEFHANLQRMIAEVDDELAPFPEEVPPTISGRSQFAGFFGSMLETTFQHTARFGRDGLRAVSAGIDLRRFASNPGGVKRS